jgi:hypothetical protein
LGKSAGTLRKDVNWKNAEPRDGWGDAATNGRRGPGVYSLVGGSLISDRLRGGPASFFLVTQFSLMCPDCTVASNVIFANQARSTEE